MPIKKAKHFLDGLIVLDGLKVDSRCFLFL